MRKLTKSLLGLALVCATVGSASAQNCSHVKETTDAFSKEAVKKATLNVGPVLWNWQLMIEQHGGKYFLGMRLYQSGDIRYVFAKGEKIYIKLENDKIVEIEADNDYLPVANATSGGVYTIWLPRGECDIKMIKRLAHSPISAIKVTLQGTEVNLPSVKDKQKKHVMEAAQCILGESENS